MMKTWLNLFRRTPREYYADFFITPPITLVLLILSVIYADIFWPIKFAFGWLLWSLYEYVTHRWVSHGLMFFREAHALHHNAQRDYISLHPAVTLAIYGLFWALFGFGYGAVSVGFSCGYVFYAFAHTAFHYATIEPGHFLYGPKLRHAMHHRADVNFGVSSSLWDRVFGTDGRVKFP